MSIVQQMIRVLQNQHTRTISFSFIGSTGQTITVNQESFRRIIRALQHDQFQISTNISPGMAAYNKDSTVPGKHGTFRVNPNGGAPESFDSLVVHESVHASFDLTSSVLPFVDNEVAAHLAQAKYYIEINRTFFPEYRPLQSAIMILGNLPAGTIPSASLNGLRNDIRAIGVYQSYINTTFNGNG